MAGVLTFPLGLTIVPSGWIIATLGIGVLVLLNVHTSTVKHVFLFLCAGVGLGLLMMSLGAAVQGISPTNDFAYASSMYAFMRSLGLCLGVSIGGTIFQDFLSQRLQHNGLPFEIALNAESYVATLRTMSSSPEKTLILETVSWAFQKLFATLCGISWSGYAHRLLDWEILA